MTNNAVIIESKKVETRNVHVYVFEYVEVESKSARHMWKGSQLVESKDLRRFRGTEARGLRLENAAQSRASYCAAGDSRDDVANPLPQCLLVREHCSFVLKFPICIESLIIVDCSTITIESM